jgi:hypothetical protein
VPATGVCHPLAPARRHRAHCLLWRTPVWWGVVVVVVVVVVGVGVGVVLVDLSSLTVLRKTLGARMMTGVLRILCVCARVCARVCVVHLCVCGSQAESEVASLLYRCSKLTDEVVYLRRLLMGRGPGAHLCVLVPATVGVYRCLCLGACVWVLVDACICMCFCNGACASVCASVLVHVHVPGTCACV